MSSIAIIDIGSNSVRLIIYESLGRSPVPLFNEKVLCGLGRHIATTGALDDTAIERACTALRRYRLLATQNDSSIHAFATAAVRDASNGDKFVTIAQEILEIDLQVLTGSEEAYYAALGIVCGFRVPHGLSADLGGGSLEFTQIDGDPKGEGMTLPLGVLLLQDEYGINYDNIRTEIDSHLSTLPFTSTDNFYAVGGTWRSLGALYMERINYPFRIMHHYELDTSIVSQLCQDILSSPTPNDIDGADAISPSRRSLLPYGAIVMERILERLSPKKIIFSAFGVREGYLYSLFPESTKQQDPLLVSARDLSRQHSRSLDHCDELNDWTKSAFDIFGISSDASQSRLREISCIVSDIAWRASPDYRGGQALNLLLHANFVFIDHPERVFLALSEYYRHTGSNDTTVQSLCNIAGKDKVFRAKLLGDLFRLAFLFTSGRSGILSYLSFIELSSGKFALSVPDDLTAFVGESVHRRLKDLSKLLEVEIVLETH